MAEGCSRRIDTRDRRKDIKATLFVLITIISIALPVNGLATELDVEAITAKPTADNPRYNNKEVWPMLIGYVRILDEVVINHILDKRREFRGHRWCQSRLRLIVAKEQN